MLQQPDCYLKRAMAPKRKAATKAQAVTKGKKVKPEPEPEVDSFHSTVEALKRAPKEKLKAKIDSACHLSSASDAQVRGELPGFMFPSGTVRGQRHLSASPG